ncbi:MAG: FAD-dependent oxidoreductase [Anaerolineae bacterium]|nr:FAD-dependent oxidoreductase [Anaerolineae bacterium]
MRKLLEEDPSLREELARLWEEARAAGIPVVALGERSVAVGGDVTGSVIVTGDQNRVQVGAFPESPRPAVDKRQGIA